MLPKHKYPAMWRILANTHFSSSFDYTDKIKKFVEEYKLQNDIDIKQSGSEYTAKLTPQTAEELKRVSDLFIHENKYKEERIETVENGIKQEILEKFKSKFKGVTDELQIDVGVVEGFDNHYSVRVDLKLGDEEYEFSPEALSYSGDAFELIGDAATNWNWAAWLGIEDSPFYDEAFVDAYSDDTLSQALEQFWNTREESTYYEELNAALDSLMKNYEPQYKFYVDLDERGEFRARVDAPNDETVYMIESEPDGEISQVRDGFMKHGTDIQGLEKYLKQLEIIPKKSSIVKGD